jgi:hypothetical protein
MNAAQLEMALEGEVRRAASRENSPVVSPYLQRPLRTLSEAKHDHDTALLDLTATDSRSKPAA